MTGIEPALSAWESVRSAPLTALTWAADVPLVTVMDPSIPGLMTQGPGDDHPLTFSQVELRGLEPLTPCFQSTHTLTGTVPDVGSRPPCVRL